MTDITGALLSIIESLAGLEAGVIAIDGRAAGGKSTLAGHLSDMLDKPGIVKMDDFFLPPKLRTAERLAQPGGNIHHERFTEEVLPYIRSGQGFEYRRFDCARMDYNGVVAVPSHPWRIVEGVYSCHPVLGSYMDVRVFLDVQPAVQQVRIKNRNTPQVAADYMAKWIPMEEAYFQAYRIRESADVVIVL